MSIQPNLFKNRNFGLLWLASIIGNFALAIAMMAETWYVVKTLGAKEQLGWVMIAGSIPRIALMAIGGVLADRMSRSRIILVSLALRVVLLFALVGLLYLQRLDIWALTAFAFFYGALDAFFWPARDTLTPAIVTDGDLTRANSIMLTTNQVGMVFGPVLGGAMLALMSYEAIFSLTGGMLFIATLCIAGIKEPRNQTMRQASSMFTELKEGVILCHSNAGFAGINADLHHRESAVYGAAGIRHSNYRGGLFTWRSQHLVIFTKCFCCRDGLRRYFINALPAQ
ncbi:MFS transporter [Deefgea sp. CFH1-16]|nr:MFS transporter [Deefgea sp. CFH1-16]